jgi:hypothetical protein
MNDVLNIFYSLELATDDKNIFAYAENISTCITRQIQFSFFHKREFFTHYQPHNELRDFKTRGWKFFVQIYYKCKNDDVKNVPRENFLNSSQSLTFHHIIRCHFS